MDEQELTVFFNSKQATKNHSNLPEGVGYKVEDRRYGTSKKYRYFDTPQEDNDFIGNDSEEEDLDVPKPDDLQFGWCSLIRAQVLINDGICSSCKNPTQTANGVNPGPSSITVRDKLKMMPVVAVKRLTIN
ncbi:unnamed protein product [Allacma fusca]|uniref:Uncharacterized protein n=1 Tax=Allacma fusca TaxID=39272 RepID=A0A8J2J6M2_9HEXA|nr:unnamed protein product [Allacma fusca]